MMETETLLYKNKTSHEHPRTPWIYPSSSKSTSMTIIKDDSIKGLEIHRLKNPHPCIFASFRNSSLKKWSLLIALIFRDKKLHHSILKHASSGNFVSISLKVVAMGKPKGL